MSIKGKVEAGLAAVRLFVNADDGDGLAIYNAATIRLLTAIMHFCSRAGIPFEAMLEKARKEYAGDCPMERYSGWDRRHDDNKAEGRPTGDQWSDDGVYYVDGIKCHGPRNYR